MEQIFNEDGSLLDINKLEFLSAQGSEVVVYKYLDLVIKIYKKDYQFSHLSFEELNILKNISTQRILLPTGTLWNVNHELIGYKMPFITGERDITEDNVSAFFEELAVLKQDLELLCHNSIILKDINLSNTLYNGNIFLIDPGNYLIGELDQIIFQVNITDTLIADRLNEIIIKGDYDKVKILGDSLSIEEKQRILRIWNYNKINKLIEMLLFSKRSNVDIFKYRQIVQFIMNERKNYGFIYSMDVLKMYFNKDLNVGDAIDDFIKKYIKDDPKERKLFLSFCERT